jgi:hypothetical protein
MHILLEVYTTRIAAKPTKYKSAHIQFKMSFLFSRRIFVSPPHTKLLFNQLLQPTKGFPRRTFASQISSGVDISSSDPSQVLRTLHRVQEIFGQSFNFSRVVMCGDQSSGKTSVLEALIGADISVKEDTMATRRPLLLTLIRIRSGMYAQFKDGEKMYSFAGQFSLCEFCCTPLSLMCWYLFP